MIRKETLILDARTVRKLGSVREAMKAVADAFRAFGKGQVQMPPKIYILLDKFRGDFRAMPAYVDGLNPCLKWVNVHPENRRKGLPSVMAIIIVSDPGTGFPLCLMDGTRVTALRTGAAGGLAAGYLARRDSRRVALVGCGVQARTQLEALKELFKLEQVNVWGFRHGEARSFIRKTQKLPGVKMEVADTVRACVKGCDVIVTTTPSRRPLLKLEWLKPGTHINAIGADARGKQELDPRILKKAKIVVDSWEQAAHSGEINVPLSRGQISRKDIYADIGEIATGRKKGRTKPDDITVFDSTGLAIQDVAVANFIYKKALKLHKGRHLFLV